MITEAGLRVVGIVVADMGKTLAFYRMLGLEVPAGADTEEHVQVPLPGGLELWLDTEAEMAKFRPDWRAAAGRPRGPASPPGRISMAFGLPDAAAVDDAYAQLTAAGYAGVLAPFDAFWGQRYATVHDPDGTGVDLFASLAS